MRSKMKIRVMFCSVVFLFFAFTGNVLGGAEGTSYTYYGNAAGIYEAGSNNAFFGAAIGAFNQGSYNTYVGNNAGAGNGVEPGNQTGSENTFVGHSAGYKNSSASYNTFIGRNAGVANTTGHHNAFLGSYTGSANTTGYQNTMIGVDSGYSNIAGNGNVFLGFQAGHAETGSNKLYIANSNTATPLIYGEFDTPKLTINGNFNVINPSGFNRFSDNLTDATQKVARIVLNHYTNTEEPIYLFGGTTATSATYAHFGGGSTSGNAVTQMDFWTAANTTTLTGTSRLTIKSDGKVGIGTRNPSYPLHMAGGAYSDGPTWVNASSREYKDNIHSLKAKDAVETLQGLNPVTFSYKTSPQENHVGFIAEDVPELIATKDRKGLSSMDIVAVLTKVVQEQQKVADGHERIIQEQQKTISILQEELNGLKEKIR